VNTLKIDRAFVTALRYGTSEAAVVRGIVLLGESLGKSVIAEGIETRDQLDTLRRLGCSTGQGYHLSRPLVPELVDKLLDEWLARSVIGAVAPLVTHETVLH
jgi:EAL domain-containing protein (putative c-di-GMP-specific phosphodiesterase class I)